MEFLHFVLLRIPTQETTNDHEELEVLRVSKILVQLEHDSISVFSHRYKFFLLLDLQNFPNLAYPDSLLIMAYLLPIPHINISIQKIIMITIYHVIMYLNIYIH